MAELRDGNRCSLEPGTDLEREFLDPPLTHRPIPFWFWNYDLDEGELLWQVREMRDKGMGGFFIHARHGLKTPYMSERWFQLVRKCIAEARRLGMKAWLYDDENWPSGTAGGRVIDEHPGYAMASLVLADKTAVEAGEDIERVLPVLDGIVRVLAVPLDGQKPRCEGGSAGQSGVINLASFVDADGTLRWRAQDGDYLVCVFAKQYYRGYFLGGYLDTLNPAAAERFIELTHSRYAAVLNREIPEDVPGIFTDEPSMFYSDVDDGQGVPWTDDIPEKFEQRWGYPIETVLPALFMDVGPSTAKYRCCFYDTVTDMYQEAFLGSIQEFCEERNMLSVGHLNAEGELFQQVKQQGDFFRATDRMHWAGFDALFDQTWPTAKYHCNNLVGCKFASSAAHVLGKPKVLGESFGVAAGWNLSLKRLKWLADWQVALGINQFCQHAFYYTVLGFRKSECPPSEFYQATYWPHYKVFADYISRLSTLFSGGRHVADVAVLYPNKSIWADMDPGPSESVQSTERVFNQLSEELLHLHYDYDYVPEESVISSKVVDGRLKLCRFPKPSQPGASPCSCEEEVAAEGYSLLIVPDCSTVSRKLVKKLEEFLEAGGKVLVIGRLPVQSPERGRDEEVRRSFERFLENYSLTDSGREVSDDGSSSHFEVGVCARLDRMSEAGLSRMLKRLLREDVAIEPVVGDVRRVVYLHYVKAGREFYFFVNTGYDEAVRARVRLRRAGPNSRASVWDAVTGSSGVGFDYRRAADGSIEFKLDLPPAGSRIICVEDGQNRGKKGGGSNAVVYADTEELIVYDETLRFDEGNIKEVHVFDDEWAFQLCKPNVLPLGGWRYREWIERIRADFHRQVHSYETEFWVQDGLEIPEVRLIFDSEVASKRFRGSSDPDISIWVNDEPVGISSTGADFRQTLDFELFRSDYIDHQHREVRLPGSLLRKGRNRVRIDVSNGRGTYEIPALGRVLLVGNFAVKSSSGDTALQAVPTIGPCPDRITRGSWTDKGFPYFSGTASYSQSFTLGAKESASALQNNEKKRYFVLIEAVADLAEVYVNARRAAVLPWEPYVCEVTHLLKRGKNVLTVKVTNTLENLMTGRPIPSGLLGRVSLVERSGDECLKGDL